MKSLIKEITSLRETINNHNYQYYILDQPIISDSEYDDLFRKLKELENKNPSLISSDSPTQRVGSKPLKVFNSLTHTIPMLLRSLPSLRFCSLLLFISSSKNPFYLIRSYRSPYYSRSPHPFLSSSSSHH